MIDQLHASATIIKNEESVTPRTHLYKSIRSHQELRNRSVLAHIKSTIAHHLLFALGLQEQQQLGKALSIRVTNQRSHGQED